MRERAFAPSGTTVNITVGAVSARVLTARRDGAQSVLVMNNGTATVWIAGGDVTVAASLTTSVPIGPGASRILTFSPGSDGALYMAAIAAGATGIVYFTPGSGL